MNKSTSAALCALIGLLTFVANTRAEVKVVTERIEAEQATPQFKFAQIPAPTPQSAATNARFTIISGEADPNGAGPEALNDGQLPNRSDDPGNNFFFNAGTPGGRIVADLGKVIEIARIDTYSWHTDTRGPQIYKLYASDGSAAGFNAKPATTDSLEKSGWTLIASVDTRQKDQKPGGQHGVMISDPAGSVGKYRYLLFDVSITENEDGFGNTFYSEIDVIDRNAPIAATRPTPALEIIIDTSRTPELADWAEKKLRPVLETWYPKIVEMFPSDGYTAPRRFTVTFKPDMDGVAFTAGTHVVCAAPWFKKELDNEAIGAVVHEMVHVVQQYHSRRNPGWLVEGIADYVRWFKYEPPSKRPHPNLKRAKYTDSYRTTAAFLNYVAGAHGEKVIQDLNTAMRQGHYTPDLWKELTNKTVDELWQDYVKARG